MIEIEPDGGSVVLLVHFELVVARFGGVEVGNEETHVVVVLVNPDAGVLEVGVAVEVKPVDGRIVGFAHNDGRTGVGEGDQGLDVVHEAVVGPRKTVDVLGEAVAVETVCGGFGVVVAEVDFMFP